MLVIRQEQIHMLGLDAQRRLEPGLLQRFAADCRDDFEALGKDRSLALVQAAVASAAKRNIVSEDAIFGLLRLFIQFGPDLERAPYRQWANELLDHPSLPGAVKVNRVSQQILARTQGRPILLHREEN